MKFGILVLFIFLLRHTLKSRPLGVETPFFDLVAEVALRLLPRRSYDDVDRRFVVPLAVATAHAISGIAILTGAHGAMHTTPLYILGLLVNDTTAASILIVTALLAVIPYLMRKPSHLVFMTTTAVLVADALHVGGCDHRLWAISRWLHSRRGVSLHPHRSNLATGNRGRAHV
jgi:hypothetical protein